MPAKWNFGERINPTLRPINPAFAPIVLTCEDEETVRVTAEVLEVLEVLG